MENAIVVEEREREWTVYTMCILYIRLIKTETELKLSTLGRPTLQVCLGLKVCVRTRCVCACTEQALGSSGLVWQASGRSGTVLPACCPAFL